MVQGQDQAMLFRGQPQQGCSQKWPPGKLKGALALLLDETVHGLLAFLYRDCTEGVHLKGKQSMVRDPLHRLFVRELKGCAQNFVALDDLLQALLKCPYAQRTSQ